MGTRALELEIVYPSRERAVSDQADLEQQGAETAIKEAQGLLPLAVLLVVAIPPGLALLARAIDRIVRGWKDHGIIIDARGTGPVRITEEKSLPYGTVVILTRDGDEAKRTDLPEEKLSDYISAALGAVAGGASASDATKKADAG